MIESTNARTSRGMTIAAIVAIAIGILVRVWHISAWDFWTDEIHTLTIASTGEYSFGPAYRLAPLNFMLTRWAIGIFGDAEFGSRIVPLIAGCLTVALMYLFGKRWLGARGAVFATILIALSPWHVQWSQTARHFSLETLFILVGLHAFLLFWRDNLKIGLFLTPIFIALALATHSSAAFYLGGLLVFVGLHWLVWLKRTYSTTHQWMDKHHAYAFVSLGIVLVVYVPVSITVSRYLGSSSVPWNPLSNLIGSLVYYVPPYFAFAALAGTFMLTADGEDLGLLLLSLVLVPVVLLIAASRVTVASSPYVLASIIPTVMLCGLALDRLLIASRSRAVYLGMAFVASGIIVSQLFELSLYHLKYNGQKPRWRAAAAFVQSHRQPGDIVVAAEGDVMKKYLGSGDVRWYDHVEPDMQSGTFPPAGASGVWYVVYTADEQLFAADRAARSRIIGSKELKQLFPLSYGAKDRTLGVFYEPGHLQAP